MRHVSKDVASGVSSDGSWVRLCAVDEVPDTGGLYVRHGDYSYAVFRLGDDRVTVMDDSCPHAGGSLSAGEMHDGCVACPWHGWPFALETGLCADNPSNPDFSVRVYPSRVVERWIEASLDPNRGR